MKRVDYKIANTTKKQRIEIVKDAFQISVIGNQTIPSDEALKYIKEYIDGVTEIEDVQKKILSIYKKEF